VAHTRGQNNGENRIVRATACWLLGSTHAHSPTPKVIWNGIFPQSGEVGSETQFVRLRIFLT
jgi:hypothetical protein